MQIDFNPKEIAFAEIVELFWKNHNPLRGIRSRQYMAAIWYHDDAQRDIIDAAKVTTERRLDAEVQTPVLPLDVFYNAEDYHQKYRLQHSPLMTYFQQAYQNFEDFNNSTAAARLNGFVAGHGRRELLEEESDGYGIPREVLVQNTRFRESDGSRPSSCGPEGCTIS